MPSTRVPTLRITHHLHSQVLTPMPTSRAIVRSPNRNHREFQFELAVAQRQAPRPSGPTKGSGELLQDQLAHPTRIGLAAHLLHDCADEGSGCGHLAVADLAGDEIGRASCRERVSLWV